MNKKKFLGQSAMILATAAQIGAPIVSANTTTTTKAPAQTTKVAATTQARVMAKKADKPQTFNATSLVKGAPAPVQFDLAPFREQLDEIRALQDEIKADEAKLADLAAGSQNKITAQTALNDKKTKLNALVDKVNADVEAKIAELNDKIKADNATATKNVTDQVTKVNSDNKTKSDAYDKLWDEYVKAFEDSKTPNRVKKTRKVDKIETYTVKVKKTRKVPKTTTTTDIKQVPLRMLYMPDVSSSRDKFIATTGRGVEAFLKGLGSQARIITETYDGHKGADVGFLGMAKDYKPDRKILLAHEGEILVKRAQHLLQDAKPNEKKVFLMLSDFIDMAWYKWDGVEERKDNPQQYAKVHKQVSDELKKLGIEYIMIGDNKATIDAAKALGVNAGYSDENSKHAELVEDLLKQVTTTTKTEMIDEEYEEDETRTRTIQVDEEYWEDVAKPVPTPPASPKYDTVQGVELKPEFLPHDKILSTELVAVDELITTTTTTTKEIKPLPKTGDASSLIGLVGTSLTGLLGLVGLKRKK